MLVVIHVIIDIRISTNDSENRVIARNDTPIMTKSSIIKQIFRTRYEYDYTNEDVNYYNEARSMEN